MKKILTRFNTYCRLGWPARYLSGLMGFAILCLFLVSYASGAAVLDGGGMLYSDSAGYMLSAPSGWIFDNESGMVNGFHCVMYPNGSSWGKAMVAIYAEINGAKGRTLEQFVAQDIKDCQKQSKNLTYRIGKKFMANKDYPAIAVDFVGMDYERVIYVQGTNSYCMVVLIAHSKEMFEKNKNKILEVIKDIYYMHVNVQK